MAVEAREDFRGCAKEVSEAETKVVWRVSGGGEYVGWDFEVSVTDADVDFGFEELLGQTREAVELGIGKELHKVSTVPRFYIIAFGFVSSISCW